MRIKHWQDMVSFVLGGWIMVSPLVLSLSEKAAWLSLALGALVVLLAIEALIFPSYLEEWGEIIAGVALLGAPWVVAYESIIGVYSSIITGALVIVFAVSEMMTDREFITWWHKHWHHPAV